MPDPVSPSSVDYHQRSKEWVGFCLLCIAFLSFMGVHNAEQKLTAVTLRCARSTGACVVERRYPVLGVRSESVPLASIRDVVLLESRGRRASTWELGLVTDRGTLEVSDRHAERPVRAAQREALQRFLADPAAPTLDLPYNQATTENLVGIGVLGGALVLFLAFLAWTNWQLVRVELVGEELTLTTKRWPLPARVRRFSRSAVRKAALRSKDGLVGHAYGGVLVHVDGHDVELLEGRHGGDIDGQRATLAQVNALLEASARPSVSPTERSAAPR